MSFLKKLLTRIAAAVQKIIKFFEGATPADREALSHYIEIRKCAGEAKGSMTAPEESIVDVADELGRDLQFIEQLANVLSTAKDIEIKQVSAIFLEMMECAARAKENAEKLFQIAKGAKE